MLQTLVRRHNLLILFTAIITLILFAYPADRISGLETIDQLAVFLGCTLLYAVTLHLVDSQEQRYWTGYLSLAANVAWLSIGLKAALGVLVTATLVFIAFRFIVKNRPDSLIDTISFITISGLQTSVAYIVFRYIFNIDLPFTTPIIGVIVPMLAALLAGYATALIIGMTVTGRVINWKNRRAQERTLFDFLLLWLTPVLPLIAVQIGPISFLVIMTLIMLQAVRYYQVSTARSQILQNTREMTALSTLGKTFSNDIDPKMLIERVYQAIDELIKPQSFFIALYDHQQDQINYLSVIEGGQQIKWPTRDLKNGLTDYIIREKKPLLLSNGTVQKMQSLGINPQEFTSASYAGVPLMVSTRVIGVMGVMDQDDLHAYDDSTINILTTIAGQTSLAIRNATLYERNMVLADNLTLINQSLQDIMFNLDQESALKRAVQIANQIVRSDKAALFLINPDVTNILNIQQSIGIEHPEQIRTEFKPELYRNGARIINDITSRTDQHTLDHAERIGFQAALEVPLRSGNTIIGYVAAYHNEPYSYQQQEVQLMEMLANQITAALDNAELLRALEMYASEQAQLVHLSRISSTNLDLDRLIIDVSYMLTEMFGMSHISIGLIEHDRHMIRYYAITGDESDSLVINDQPIEAVPEIQQMSHDTVMNPYQFARANEYLSESLRQLMEDQDSQMMLVIPMLINQTVIGVILMGSNQAVHINDNERRLIEMAAHQISAQVHNARIHGLTEESLVQRLEELALIEDIAQQISKSLEVDKLIENVLQAAIQATEADFASIALINNETRQFDIIEQKYIDGTFKRQTSKQGLDEGVIGHVAHTGESQIIPDNTRSKYYIGRNNNVYASSLAVPLISSNTIIGVLNLESSFKDFFTLEQAGFVKSLAGHAAISLSNATLLEERQHQIHTLTQLRQLTLKATATLNQRSVISAILHTAAELMNAVEVALYVYSSQAGELVLMGGQIRHDDVFIDAYPSIPNAIIYEAARRDVVEVVENTTTNPFYDEIGDPNQLKHRSALIVPIRRRKTVREVLCIGFSEAREFTTRDINTVELLGAQAASHLENAELHVALRTSNNQMRAILDANHDGIILLDRAGRVLDANVSAGDMLGIELHNRMGAQFVKLLIERAGLTENGMMSREELLNMARLYRLDPQRITEREYALDRAGERLHIKEIGTPVNDADGRIIGRLLLLRDVTDEQKLTEYRQKIQSMVLHDLRGPLSSIISSMYLGMSIIEDIKDDNIAPLKMTLDVSLESATNLLNLVESLRDIPRLEQGQMELDASPADLRQIAEKAYESLVASFVEAEQQVDIELPDELPSVYVDSDIIRRVIINLLHNAYKFSPVGEAILITTDTTINQNGFVSLMICDQGPGIPADMRQRIFGEFEQINTLKPQRGGRGSGLGLTFCKLAVEAHGGEIWVAESGPTKGACFVIKLPTEPIKNQRTTKPADYPDTSQPKM